MAKIKKEQLEQLLGTDLDGTAHRLFYVDGSGDVQELGFGTSGHVLTSAGAAAAPSFQAPSGGGGGGKFVLPISFEVSPTGGTRFYAGDSTGGTNDSQWGSFRDPWTGWNRGFDIIAGGWKIPYGLTNVRFSMEFYISGGTPSGTLTARCFSVAAPTSGDSYLTTYTQTLLASGTVAVSANNTMYIVQDTVATNSFTALDTLVFGIETDTFSGMAYRCKLVIYADYT